jgi:SAM-dependent methyltransferase
VFAVSFAVAHIVEEGPLLSNPMLSKSKLLAETAVRDPHEAARMVRKKMTYVRSEIIARILRSNIIRVAEGNDAAHRMRLRAKSRSDVFSRAYGKLTWGGRESGSGAGSDLRATEVVRAQLTDLLHRHNVTSLLDAPCGDWNWMQHIDLTGIEYFGADIVPSVIAANQKKFERPGVSFAVADLTRDKLPSVEAVICRDCLVHVSYHDISEILANFRRTGATWLLVSTHPEVENNRNQFTGARWRRLNLQLPPFNFPDPVETLSDGGDVDPRQLSLWRMSDLPELAL